MRKIGILTGGGDCPGLNAVIRGVVQKCLMHNIEVIGLKKGWKGALTGDSVPLTLNDVEDILSLGGTILQSSRTNILKEENGPEKVREVMKRLGLEGIVAVGGDDTLGVANKLQKMGMNMIGVPKTIDNDLSCTDYTFGFDTATNTAAEAIDRLHTTAKSHSRCFVVEVMGRNTGWIAIQAGMAAGAHIILIPEFPKSIDEVVAIIEERRKKHKNYCIICVAEGFELTGVDSGAIEKDDFGNIRLDKKEIGPRLAKLIEERTGMNTRATVLGHIIRGGSPTAYDRVLGTKLGVKAAELAVQEKYGYMVALHATDIIAVELEKALSKQKRVDAEYYNTATLFR
ncbi:MAG TPA: ATP-dependent 6-phosphofructokinase [Flavisolibacter sp.]|jgi:ATP-dependent phosphofructokinase / diphosphate-dependent phosphofructokinase|nr:ATP-dependent 6-phosphofructokinase [Flavisolibacter sp.]